jgi:hypothetical protein
MDPAVIENVSCLSRDVSQMSEVDPLSTNLVRKQTLARLSLKRWIMCNIGPEVRPVRTLAQAEQRIKRLEDIISWVQAEARCIKTRRFIAKAIREMNNVQVATSD